MFFTVNLAQDQSKISRYLSSTLLDKMENTLKKGEKILLYLNKRGSHNSLICKDCQYLWECQNCDVSLSVHSHPRKLLCHLCGNSEGFPLSCKNCQGTNLLSVGVGTQQIEEVLKEYFKEQPKGENSLNTSLNRDTSHPQSGILSPLEEKGATVNIRKSELKSPGYVFELAKKFRKNAPKTEEQTWKAIRGNQIKDLKFRRQHPIGRYIADFYNEENNLVLELDGKIHEEEYQKKYDEERTVLLTQYGYKVLRIKNEDLQDKNKQEIQTYLEKKIAVLLSSKGEEIQRGGRGMKSGLLKPVIYRFDSDSMKNISSKKAAIGELEAANIIIGTKMITTGFDFSKVGLIGVILVEQELGYPSFDAQERAYANLKQLIGRGNRKSQETNIILQTFIPKHQSVLHLTESHMKDFFATTLKQRKEFSYPPYTELVKLEYRDSSAEKTLKFLEKLVGKLEKLNTHNEYIILSASSTFRKNNSHHAHCIVKGPNVRSILKHIEPLILKSSKLSVIFS